MKVNLAPDDTDKNPDLIREIGGLNSRKYYSGGRRAPANVVPRPTVPVPGLVADAEPDDGDVCAQRPQRCNVYRASHTPN